MTASDLDLENLLQPFAGEPCGADLQYAPEYDTIRLARQVDQSNLPSGVWERQSPRKVDWVRQATLCIDMLATRSKDLQVAAWLVEALVYERRLRGFAQGMSFFVKFSMTFWANAFPQIEDGDAELRVRPIDWLLREAQRWVQIGILDPSMQEDDAGDPEERHSHWKSVESDLHQVDSFIDAEISQQAPSCQDLLKLVASQRAACAPPEADGPGGSSDDGDAVPRRSRTGTREAAYDELSEIATLLARLEPHSPVPSVLRGLASWRDASFEDLLEHLPQGGPSVYELAKLFRTISMGEAK